MKNAFPSTLHVVRVGKYVCVGCVRDMFAARHAQPVRTVKCIACGDQLRPMVDIGFLADEVQTYLPAHFMVDDDLYPGYGLDLAKVVGMLVGCEHDLACKEIAQLVVKGKTQRIFGDDETEDYDEDLFALGQQYCVRRSPFDSEEHERWFIEGDWEHMRDELTHGRRFFNEKVREFFDDLIVEALTAKDRDGASYPAVGDAVPGTSLYRARIANEHDVVKACRESPAQHLGAPPRNRAGNNRMSPAGIPVMYLSSDAETAIAELRPAIDDLVAVGRFTTTDHLTFFDFTKLSRGLRHERISLLDPNYEERDRLRSLLRYLHDRIAQPVRDNDKDYVITQALAEYIRFHHTRFDGIIFRSVQNGGGFNYVLFDRCDGPINAIDYEPIYRVEIKPSDVQIHKVTAVGYQSKLVLDAD